MKKNICLMILGIIVIVLLSVISAKSKHKHCCPSHTGGYTAGHIHDHDQDDEQDHNREDHSSVMEENSSLLSREDSKARIAVIIDDLGYRDSSLEQIFNSNTALTLSILPDLPFSVSILTLGRAKGYECILHMPMEPVSNKVRLEPKTILTTMSDEQITNCLSESLERLSGITGVSNHMGSRVTADERIMRLVLGKIKDKGLYFMDSRTTAETVCPRLCASMHIRCIQRDVFLDGEPDKEYIKSQFDQLKKAALAKGRAVGIMHDRDLSIEVMNEVIPEFRKAGIKFVFLSELIKE